MNVKTTIDPEIIRKFKNTRWRLNHLYKIIDKNKKRIQFKENIFQKIVNDYTGNRKMILKPRQIGFSTNELLKQLDDCSFNKNRTNVIISHERDSIDKLFRIIRIAYDNMPEKIKPILDRGGGSRHELYFPEINSRIYTDLEVRSDTISWAHISEAHFANEDRIKATLEAVPMHGKVTMETTANGVDGYFYERWVDKEDIFYKKFFFPWFMNPEYQTNTELFKFTEQEKQLALYALTNYKVTLNCNQIAWRRIKVKDLKEKFYQEYPEDDETCFLTSGSSVMDLMHIKKLIAQLDQNKPLKRTVKSYDCEIKIFKEKINDHRYVIGADVAEGIGQDKSAATVIDIDEMEQVASVCCDLKPYTYAYLLNEMAELYKTTKYNWPELAVECNNHGHTVLSELQHHILYPNLYFYAKDRPGFKTDMVTRPVILDKFEKGVENETLLINDEDTLRECLTLVNKNGRIEHASGKHDDRIFACAIALQVGLETLKNTKIGKIYI